MSSLDRVKVKLDTFSSKWDNPTSKKPVIINEIDTELERRKQNIISTALLKWNTALQWREDISSDKAIKKTAYLTIDLSVAGDNNNSDDTVDYNTLIDVIEYLDNEEKKKNIFKHHSIIDDLLTFVDQNILKPILDLRVGSVSFSEDDDNTLLLMDVDRRYDYKSSLTGVHGLDIVTKELVFVLLFLKSKLEKNFSTLYERIKRRSSTRFISTLMSSTFAKLLPQSEKDLAEFESYLGESASRLQLVLIDAGWLSQGSDELSSWAQNLYHEWINCKQALVLDEIRQKLLQISQEPEFELQRVADAEFSQSHNQRTLDEHVTHQQEETDGWDNWNDDEEPSNENANEGVTEELQQETADDGWDAWDDEEHSVQEESADQPAEEEDGWDAWGDDSDIQVTDVQPAKTPKKVIAKVPNSNESQIRHQAAKITPLGVSQQSVVSDNGGESRREALLCSISTLPASILSNITSFVNETLRFIEHHQQPQNSLSRDQVEVQILERNVSEMLSLYRALSSLCYTRAPTPFILYNDIVYLVSKLRSIEVEDRNSENSTISLTGSNDALFDFADYQYKLAITEQQTRILEILANASHFQNCNSEENLFSCQGAIERIINVFYEVSNTWEEYLSFPLRAKALGTLLEFVASTLIKDIENLADISAEESTELSKLIKVIQQLETLFQDPTIAQSALQQGGEASEELRNNAAALTFYYTPSWIKLQYLEQILVSNLEQISYLFRNNSLVDFTPRELDELIRALFSPSEQRQNTINKIYGTR